MAFPTTSVLTTFTGADEDPLSEGNHWAQGIQISTNSLRRVGNQCARQVSAPSGTGQNYWAAQIFGPDVEAYVTIPTLTVGGGSYVQLWGRLHNPGQASTAEGYIAVYIVGTGFACYRMLPGEAFTQIGSTDGTVASAGDKIGLEVIGTTVRCMHYTGGVWVQRASGTDTNITGTGYIGLEIGSDNTGRVDDFGGGTVVITPSIAWLGA